MNLKTDGSSDLLIEHNQLVLCEGSEEITQLVAQRLKTFYGEWFLNNSIGIPYFQKILEKNPNPATIEAIFTKEIIDTDGVLEITSMDLDIDNSLRSLAVTAEMRVEGDPKLITFTTSVGG
jgi:hypothetical protein